MPIVGVRERDPRTGAIVFERDDGSTFWAPPIPEAEQLARDLESRRAAAAPAPEPVETAYAPEQAAGDITEAFGPEVKPAPAQEPSMVTVRPVTNMEEGKVYRTAPRIGVDAATKAQMHDTSAPNAFGGGTAGGLAPGARYAPPPSPAALAAPVKKPETAPPTGPTGAPSPGAPPSDPRLGSPLPKRPMVSYGPTPARTPESMRLAGGEQIGDPDSQAYVVPQQGAVKTEGVKVAPTPEWMAEQERIYQAQEQQVADQREAEQVKWEAENAAVENRASIIGDEMRAQDTAVANLRAQRRAYEQRLATADEAISDWKMDPNRLFKDKGAFATVAAVVAQALGAYAATLGGTPNFAGDMIQRAIDRDVEAQRQDFLARKDKSNTLVARLNLVLNDIETATLKAKEIELQAAQNYAQQLAMTTKRQDILTNSQNMQLLLDEKIQATRLQIMDRAGTASISGTGKVQLPRAASPGGTRPATNEEWLKGLKGEQALADQFALRMGLPTSETRQKELLARGESRGKVQGEIDVRGEGAGQLELKPETLSKYQDDLKIVNEAETELKQAEALLQKHVQAGGDLSDIPGVGWWDRQFTLARSPEARKNTGMVRRLVAAYVRATSGAAATDNERDYLFSALVGYSDKEFQAGVEYIRERLNAKRNDLNAVYNATGAPQAYDRGLQKIVQDARKIHGLSGGEEGITGKGIAAIEQDFEDWKAKRSSGIEQGREAK